jgi:protein TonB
MRPLNINHVAFFSALALHGLILSAHLTPEPFEMPRRINVRLVQVTKPAPQPAIIPEPVRPPEPREVKRVQPAPLITTPTPKPQPRPRPQGVEKSLPQPAFIETVAIPIPQAAPVEAPPAMESVAVPVQNPSIPAKSEPLPVAVEKSLLGDYLETVRRAVEMNKEYPSAARQLGQQGSVIIRVRILRDGHLAEAGVIASSGHRHLDRAAVAAVRRAAPLKAPAGFDLDDVVLEIPITFRLI